IFLQKKNSPTNSFQENGRVFDHTPMFAYTWWQFPRPLLNGTEYVITGRKSRLARRLHGATKHNNEIVSCTHSSSTLLVTKLEYFTSEFDPPPYGIQTSE
ncbi:hypothetical protein PV327_011268, partial [Microctonus hyperodae]